MIVAIVAERDEAKLQCLRAQGEERIGARAGCAADNNRGLAGVIQHQGRQHQTVPGEPDRPGSEMPHIGIERLSAGRAQKDGAQHQKAGEAVPEQITEPVAGVECDQHTRVTKDASESEQPDCDEPDRHNRAE